MSKFIKREIGKKKIEIYNFSDLHEGSISFHEEAFEIMKDKVLSTPKAFVTFGGDSCEAKLVNSPHFNPDGLKPRQLDSHKQADAVAKLWKPLAKKTLLFMPGNHDQYLSPNFDLTRYICERTGMEHALGSYQSWLQVNDVTMHFWHGRSPLPRGAKDPIQRKANQQAWLKNKLAPLAGSAQAQYMAHTHALLVVPPIKQYALLNSGDNCKARYFTEEVREIDGKVWVPPDARWYVNTGTFRRSGSFEYQDYSEESGYAPQPIGCTKTYIDGGRIVHIEEVVL